VFSLTINIFFLLFSSLSGKLGVLLYKYIYISLSLLFFPFVLRKTRLEVIVSGSPLSVGDSDRARLVLLCALCDMLAAGTRGDILWHGPAVWQAKLDGFFVRVGWGFPSTEGAVWCGV